jgi:hypothetical protein
MTTIVNLNGLEPKSDSSQVQEERKAPIDAAVKAIKEPILFEGKERWVRTKQDGSRWVHENQKSKHGDKILGEGHFKKAVITNNVDSGKRYCRTTEKSSSSSGFARDTGLRIGNAEEEVDIINYLRENKVPNLIDILHSGFIESKHSPNGQKFERIQELCEGGMLVNCEEKSLPERIRVTEKILDTLIAAENLGYILKDPRVDNVLLNSNGDPIFADWGYVLICDPKYDLFITQRKINSWDIADEILRSLLGEDKEFKPLLMAMKHFDHKKRLTLEEARTMFQSIAKTN